MSRDPYTGKSTEGPPLFSPVAPAEAPAAPEGARTPASDPDAAMRGLLSFVDAWGEEPTSGELAAWMGISRTIAAQSLAVLKHAGKVAEAGQRKCRKVGVQCITWSVR